MSNESCLHEIIDSISPTDASAEAAAWQRLDNLTKPPRSLGRLEELAAKIARIQGTDRPHIGGKVVLLMAGDHGVVAEGVALYPQDVTWQMVANFTASGAAINQIASAVGAEVRVHDVGVAKDLDGMPGVVHCKVAHGTANMAQGPAMTREQCAEAVLVGVEAARRAVAEGADVLATGEMGIGNTTPAAALVAVYAGAEPSAVVGRGTGLDDEALAHKVKVVERAIAVNDADALDPLGVLAALGGLEIAAMTGAIIGAAEQGVPIVSDGVISGAAALAATRICPAAADYLLVSHRSVEPAHDVVFEALGLKPVLDLDMRLGEGTGAALTLGILDAACRMMSGMATFAEAGVSEAEE